jgi:2-haloacid dehalogenase
LQALSIDSLKNTNQPQKPIYGPRTNCKTRGNFNEQHGWDLAGASHAGLATCFIAREGQSLYTLSSTPDFEATDILAMAEQLVAA